MRAFTSCAGCGEYLRFLSPHDDTHALCQDPRRAERGQEKAFLAAVMAGDDRAADALADALDTRAQAPPRLLDAALAYAAWGWPVFPLHPASKVPLTRHGFHDATIDPARIHGWWRATPSANIGLPTGTLFDVIDIDFRVPGTWARWLALQDAPSLPPVHGMVSTASSGLHLYVHTEGAGNTANVAPGIDYRGHGGYVVAPPSRLDGTHRWEWWCYPSPFIKDRGHHGTGVRRENATGGTGHATHGTGVRP